MKPRRIHMSDALRDDFKATLRKHNTRAHAILDDYRQQQIQVPVALPDLVRSSAYGDAINEVKERSPEAQALLTTLMDVASGSCEPAVIIENLPEDDVYARLFMRGITASLSSDGNDPETTFDITTKEGKTVPSHIVGPLSIGKPSPLTRKDERLEEHRHQSLHQDSSSVTRQDVSSMARLIRAHEQSNPPLTTAICTADEVIDGITDSLFDEYGKDFDSREDFREHISTQLNSEIWQSNLGSVRSYLVKNDAYREGVEGSCRYSFTPQLEMQPYKSLITPLNDAIAVSFLETIEAFKQTEGAALQPTEVLFFNNALVLHGSGCFLEQDPDKPAHDKRVLDNYSITPANDAPKHLEHLQRKHGISDTYVTPNPAEVKPYTRLSEAYVEKMEARGREKAEKLGVDTGGRGR